MKQKKKRGVLDSHVFNNLEKDMQKTEFYNTLFDKEDWVCFGQSEYDIESWPYYAAIEKPGMNFQFLTVNPMKEWTTRSVDNVTKFRTMLFEIDEDSNKEKVPLEIQVEIIKQSGLPYSTAVFSGGKSIHWLISVDEPFRNKNLYRMHWLAIASILNQCAVNLGYKLKFDSAVKNPSRYTRVPGSIRNDNKKLQKLITVKGRVSRYKLSQWIEANGENVNNYKPKEYKLDHDAVNSSTNKERIDYVLKFIMKDDKYEDGNYNYQLKMACALLRTQMTPDEIKNYYLRTWNHIHENDPIKGATELVQPGEIIKVYTKAEKKEWAKQKHLVEARENEKLMLQRYKNYEAN